MVFLSNYLVFKIVLAALGRVDYPVAGDLELKYDNANKIYLSGGSLNYVDDATLYTTIGGETTGYDIQFNSLNLDASNEQIVYASDAEVGDELGNSCDVYGEYAVVGASKEDTNGSNAGSVYVYHRLGNTWIQQAKLTASDGEASDLLGGQKGNLAIYGDTVVVGARDEDTGGSAAGSAYVFVRSGTTWSQQAILRASNAGASDQFATGVAIYKDTIVIGAPTEDTTASDAGSLYVFTRSGTTWTQRAQLQASNAGASDRLGDSVSIDGDTIIAGAYQEDTTASDAGSAYIFTGSGATWAQQAQIQASDAAATDYFGYSVSISGNTVVVGARYDDDGGSNSGSAYVFVRSGTTWTQQAKLTASDAQASDDFGWNVDIDKDHIVVTAPREDTNASDAGAVYVFSRSGSTWTEIKKIRASITVGSINYLGYGGAAIHDGTIITAAPNESTKATYAGAAYIYGSQRVTNYYITDAGKYSVDATIAGLKYKTNEVEVTGSITPVKSFPTTAQKLYPSDGGTVSDSDYYGYVGLSGNGLVMVVVGRGDDDTTTDSGGFIVYEKINGVWTFTQQITNVGSGSDTFGLSEEGKAVQLDYTGTRVFIGAHADDHSTTNTGSVYIYKRVAQGNWTLEQRIDGGAASYRYGYNDVNNDGDKLMIGSYGYPGSGNVGRVWYYTRSGTTWSLQEELAAPSTSAYGTAVAMNSAGTRAIIGGYTHSSNTGRVDIWNYSSGSWSIGSGFTGVSGDDYFGWNVDMSNDGNTVVVGAPLYSAGGAEGRVYIYTTSDGTNWSLLKTLSNQDVNEWFGFSVQISGDGNTVVIGAGKNDDGLTNRGKSYVYVKSGGSWPSTPTYTILGTTANANNGYTLGISDTGETIISGAPFDDDKGSNQGAVYIFDKSTLSELTFDNYNKLSIGNAPTNTSSKLFFGSNVYDIGTLTSDLTIETPGLYRGLVFDTSSNVAYFNKTTVGAIASTMAGYEVEQILYGTHNSDSPSQGGFGHYIDTNGDGTRFVLGLGMDPTTGQYDGRAKVYHLESGTWTLKVDIPSPNTASQRFGDSVCMNEDGTRIVVNHYPNNKAYIYDYASGAWPTTPTATIIGGVTSFGEGDMDMNKAGTVIVFGSRGTGTQIWSRAGDGTWSETKNWGNGFGGYGVAINGAGTRIVTGKESTGEIFEANYVGGSWGSLTSVIDTSYTSWPAKIRMDSDGTTLIVNADPATEAGIYERQSGTSWTLSQSILSMASYYSRNGLSISYDGNMILVGDMTNDTDGNNFGRAFLWNKSGGSWSLTKTFSNPKTSPAVNDYWGAGVAIAKNTKDRLIIGMSADSTAGTDYGSVWTYTNAIPDFISFDGYNKLSLSGITNPTSKIHALPTGAESTTTYDIGSATNIYIESAGTYTAEMKGSDAFALDSNVVGTIATNPLGNYRSATIPSAYLDYGSSSDRQVTICFWYKHTTDQPGHHADARGPVRLGTSTTASGAQCAFGVLGTFADGTNRMRGYTGMSNNSVYTYWDNLPSGFDETKWNFYIFRYMGNGNNHQMYLPEFDYSDNGSGNYGQSWRYVVFDLPDEHGSSLTDFSVYEGDKATTESWRTTLYNGGQIGGAANETTDRLHYLRFHKDTIGDDIGSKNTDISSGSITPSESLPGYSAAPSLNFDTYNKYTFTGADTDSTYKLKYESNTYDLGTISNVYIANPGTYSAEIKGATNFALSSNVATIQTVTQPTLVNTIPITAGDFSGYNYQHEATDTINTYYEYNMSLNATGSTYFIGYNWTTKKWFDTNPTDANNTFGISATDTAATSRETIENPAVVYVIGTNNSQIVLESQFINPYFLGPSLDFDTYNKLTLSGLESGSTSTLKYGSNTYDIGTASNVYISEQGTYDAESKGTTTFALTSNVTGALSSAPISFTIFPSSIVLGGWWGTNWSGSNYSKTSNTSTKIVYDLAGGVTAVLNGTQYGITFNATTTGIELDLNATGQADTPYTFTSPTITTAVTSGIITVGQSISVKAANGNEEATFTVPDFGYISGTPTFLNFDGYKLVVKNITPTSTTLKYGSNTYEIGTATNIYVENTGDYSAEIGNATDFALTNTTVSGTIKTVEPTLSGGYFFGHALTYDGKLYGWGENSNGELGVGDTTDKTVPTLCTGITQGEVVSIWNKSKRSQNQWAKTRDGKIWVTGEGTQYNIPGQTSNQTSFIDVTSYFGDQSLTANNITQISGHGTLTVSALTETGNVWTWGTHNSSMWNLGQGTGASSSNTPKQITFGGVTDNISRVAFGHDHGVALDTDGDVWFWGQIWASGAGVDYPQTTLSDVQKSPHEIMTSNNIIGVSSTYFTIYAWQSDGTYYALGQDSAGQIGDGTATAGGHTSWQKVEYFSANNITINEIYGGTYHVFADTSDGYYCWGGGTHGNFGNGSTGNLASPTKWTNVSNIKLFSAGGTSMDAAITEDGKYYAWGRGTNYARGDNTTGDISYPKYIDTLPNILAPSFEFDGYDKILAHMEPTSYVYEFFISVVVGAVSENNELWLQEISSTGVSLTASMMVMNTQYRVNGIDYDAGTSVVSGLFDGSTGTSNRVGVYPGYHDLNQKIFTLTTTQELTDITLVSQRPKYMPGWKIVLNGTTIVEDSANNGTSGTPEPFSITKTLSPVSNSLTKYTKGTTTYDANQAQIITVSDPGTYDAQIKSGTDFNLKSATVPATSSSGLYTWAFHHGNFDNAYGDGDILTARENGRFYADTPAYTGDIGTITPTSVSSFVYKFYCTVLPGPTTGHTTDANGTSWILTEISSTTTTLTSSMFTWVDSNYVASGSISDLFDGDTSEFGGNVVVKNYNDGGLAVNRHMFTITSPVELLQLSISTHRPGYYPGIKIILNDTHTLVNETSNQGTGATPSPYTKSYTFSSNYIASTHGTKYTFAPPSGGLTANVLMVAGGGGGGGRAEGGGGGAGGLVYTAGTSLVSGATKTIVVGNGDSGGIGSGSGNIQVGFNGKDTTFTGLTTADGGGGGGSQTNGPNTGGSGGGGNGGDGSNYNFNTGASGTSNQGNTGGNGANTKEGGGGGGAGGVGANASSGNAGNGGIGKFFGTGSSFTNFGDEYGEGGYFAGGGGGGNSGEIENIPGGRGGGGYGGNYNGYMARGGSQHGMVHTGGGGGGVGTVSRDQHPGYNTEGDGGVRGHGGRGGSGIVLLQTNVAPPNGSNTAVVQVGNPRRRSLPPAVEDTGSEVNRFSIIDSASMPTYKLPTHWYTDPVGRASNSVWTTQGSHSLQKRADGGTSNVFYVTSSEGIFEYGSYMAQSADAIFMPVEAQRYNGLLAIGSNSTNDIHFEMAADGTAALYYGNGATLLSAGTITCFTVGKWHHIALTVDSGGNAVGYVNGYPVVSGTHTSVAAVGSRSGNMHMRVGDHSITFRKFLTYEVSTYNFLMSPKQVLQRAAEVGLGPKLEYDGLNTIKILNTEPGSSVKLFTSNVADTSNVFIVADPAAGEYTVPESGKYYAEIKGTDTFTVTRTIDADEPLYQYPPVVTGTKSSLTTSLSADTWNTWTMSGASTGNGQYQAKTSHATVAPGGTHAAAAGVFTNGVKIEIISDGGASIYSFLQTSQLTNFDITLQLPSAKTIRKYVLYPADTNAPVSTPGGSVDPTLPGNGSEENTRRPKSWVLKGSNDDTSWTTIHTVTNKPPSIYGDVHTVSSPASYQYYQLSISVNNGSSSFIQLGEWQLWGDA